MARYQHLPIYKDAYLLLNLIMEISRKLPREYKYTLGQRMQNKAIDLLVDIYKANNNADKISQIDNLLLNLQLLGLFVRICLDSKLITPEKYAAVVELQMSVLKQATSWRCSQFQQSQNENLAPSLQEQFIQPDLFGTDNAKQP